MNEQVDDAKDVILEGAAEVAEGVADIARGFSGLALSGAFVVGAAAGGALGYFICYRRMETKYSQLADQAASDVVAARQYYADKVVALENTQGKTNLEDIIRERGYTPEPEPGQPPMAVTPPAAVVEAAADDDGDVIESEAVEAPVVRNIFRDVATDVKDADHDWDWQKEKQRRSPVRPYVIHIDEREEMPDYDGVTFTYYEDDDVVCNERDEVLDAEERERVLGEANLERFGHGSGDENAVYIRNDSLEIVFEVIKSPNSYAEEVHGFTPPDPSELRHSHRRVAFDDD